MRTSLFVPYFLVVLLYAETYFMDVDDIPAYYDDDDVDEDISRPEFEKFMDRFGNDYGYNGTLDAIRQSDLKRTKGSVYLDYTGSGVYRESQIRKWSDMWLSGFYGNAHSRSPSSMNTEHEVKRTRRVSTLGREYAYTHSQVF